MMITKKLEDVYKQIILGQKTAILGPKKSILGNRGHETARREAKRSPTGKPKVSRVTPGYEGLMISLSGLRLTQKMGVI